MKQSIFSNRKLQPLFSLICAFGWSAAYPLIRVGYREFNILSADVGSKIMFAGIRFFFAGLILVIFGKLKKDEPLNRNKKNLIYIFLFAVVNTTLNYLFSYLGLGYISGARASVMEPLNMFFLIILSCIFLKDDRFSVIKAIGCILGFAGILSINIGKADLWADLSIIGDGCMLLHAVFGSLGGFMTRTVLKGNSMTYATGFSMLIGGAFLCVIALFFSQSFSWTFTPIGLITLFALILISSVCFEIYNKLLTFHPISKVAIFNALIPIGGVIFSAIFEGEPFKLEYIVAGVLTSLGIVIVNLSHKKTKTPLQ